MNRRIARISGAAVLGVALMLGAGPAAAIGFNWTFGGVQGMVTGLADNTAGQAATSVMLTNAGGLSHTVPWELVGSAVSNAWTVAGGAVTAVAFRAENWQVGGDVLDLTNFAGTLFDGLTQGSVTGTVQFTRKVPEPTAGLLVAAGLLAMTVRRRIR